MSKKVYVYCRMFLFILFVFILKLFVFVLKGFVFVVEKFMFINSIQSLCIYMCVPININDDWSIQYEFGP